MILVTLGIAFVGTVTLPSHVSHLSASCCWVSWNRIDEIVAMGWESVSLIEWIVHFVHVPPSLHSLQSFKLDCSILGGAYPRIEAVLLRMGDSSVWDLVQPQYQEQDQPLKGYQTLETLVGTFSVHSLCSFPVPTIPIPLSLLVAYTYNRETD